MNKQDVLLNKALVIGIFILFIGMTISSGMAFKIDSPVVLLDENFSGTFLPDGWSTDCWTQSNICCCVSEPPCAYLLAYSQSEYDGYIISKAIDASNYEIVYLRFFAGIEMVYGSYCDFYVKYRMNETSPWENILSFTSGMDFCDWFEIEINCGPEGCGDALQIKWIFMGYYYYGWEACLDDVKILGNNPPYEPSDPDPPDGAENWTGGGLCWTGGDPDGDDVLYDVFFGSSSPPPQIYYNQPSNCTDIYGPLEFNTTYYWKIVAWDEHGALTEGPIWSFTTRGNSPPNAPIIYEENGSIFIYTTDPDGDDIFYLIDWGDGTNSSWIGPYESGEIIEITHEWPEGIYEIRVKAKDIYGAESPWSDPFIIVIGNQPPDAPIIDGPKCGDPGVEYCLTFVADDFEEDNVKYEIDWGDDTFYDFGPFPSGEEVNACHSWDSKGVYYIIARAIDREGKIGDWSDPYKIVIGNKPPEAPDINGPQRGKVGIEYNFTFVTEDSDGDNIIYEINWGDDTIEEKGPYSSGVEIIVNHSWEESKTYIIKARAKDEFCGYYSAWTEFKFIIPRNRETVISLFQLLFDRFPLLEVIILRAMNLLR